MKRAACFTFLVFFLMGCSRESGEIETGMQLRTRLLKAQQCGFSVHITTDYGDTLQKFSMDCSADVDGNISFVVTAPDTISDISGKLTGDGGELVFDDSVLMFPLLAEGSISPVSSPWILIKTLRSGYLTSAGFENNKVRLSIDDSYRDNSLHLDIWLQENDFPEYADILYEGKRIVHLSVENFWIV